MPRLVKSLRQLVGDIKAAIGVEQYVELSTRIPKNVGWGQIRELLGCDNDDDDGDDDGDDDDDDEVDEVDDNGFVGGSGWR